jgi:ankyrin repeat protein
VLTATPLQAAARNGLTDVLKPLLDAGADPNVRNEVSSMFTGVHNHIMVGCLH